jgi:hypothetical protein
MDKSKPVGIWIGVSTEDQAKGNIQSIMKKVHKT